MQFLPQLVGNNFRSTEERDALLQLRRGDKLRLERDPENPFHENAIKVILDSEAAPFHLGFIERSVADDLAPIMDNSEGAVSPGWTSEIKQCEVFDLTNPKKPTLLIEITTGWEIPTAVNVGGEEDPDGYNATIED